MNANNVSHFRKNFKPPFFFEIAAMAAVREKRPLPANYLRGSIQSKFGPRASSPQLILIKA
jgi:hypothetical protein